MKRLNLILAIAINACFLLVIIPSFTKVFAEEISLQENPFINTSDLQEPVAVGVIIRTDSRPVVETVSGVQVLSTAQGASLNTVNNLNSELGAGSIDVVGTMGVFKDMVSIALPEGVDINAAIDEYERDPNVLYAVPNVISYLHSVPNDTYYGGTNSLNYYQWNFSRIKVEDAWEYLSGKGIDQGGASSIKVAVIDSGVAFEDYGAFKKAPELSGVKFSNPISFKSITFTSDYCSSGKYAGKTETNTHPNDDEGHGTHVTGTIAQMTNNATHSAGIADNVTIIPIKTGYKCKATDGSYTAIMLTIDNLAGMEHAVSSGAKVINMSLGSTFRSSYYADVNAYIKENKAYIDAIEMCRTKGVTVVVATGNDGKGETSPGVSSPGALPGTISVGATRWDNKKAYYSNFGAPYSTNGIHGVDIVAPGGDYLSYEGNAKTSGLSLQDLNDQNKDGMLDGILQQTIMPGSPASFTDPAAYPSPAAGFPSCVDSSGNFKFLECGLYQGTSMAAPHVTGVVALMYSVKPTATAAEIRSGLLNSSNSSIIPDYSTHKDWYGAGLVDAGAAVKAVGGSSKAGDANNDGSVDIQDIEYVADRWGT